MLASFHCCVPDTWQVSGLGQNYGDDGALGHIHHAIKPQQPLDQVLRS